MNKRFSRRSFFKRSAVLGAGVAFSSLLPKWARPDTPQDPEKPDKPKTNIEDALKHPRTETSMPGKFPAKVVKVTDPAGVAGNKPIQAEVTRMLAEGMLALTGAAILSEAWRMFVKPGEVVGLKVNPVAGKQLSTSIEVTRAVIGQLMDAGIPEKDIVIWDRRLFQLEEAGFTKEAFPGIKLAGTEVKDENGSFYGKDGKLYSEHLIDKDWYYWADVDGEYDEHTMPYMVNDGKYSYFTKICTQDVDKIINMPILKNAGASVTLCMKNLAYGVTTNTGRLHKQLWSETNAEVCAFPPVRDKVVLNIVDGLIGCYQGGPGANPQYITNFDVLLLGSDPVAVDRIGYEIIQKKRREEGIQKEESPNGRKYMKMAEKLGLGTEELEKIDLKEVNLV